jgi:predicted nuclease of predicted toxin-antitoxin system
MRLLVDENVPRSVSEVFREHGHEIIFVKYALGEGTADQAIATYANEIDAIVVTWNHRHFKRWVSRAAQGQRHVGRISFRLEEVRGAQRARQCMPLIEAEYALA